MIEQFIKDVEDLLEWMPVCSVGSSGHTRRTKVEAGLAGLRADLRTEYAKYGLRTPEETTEILKKGGYARF